MSTAWLPSFLNDNKCTFNSDHLFCEHQILFCYFTEVQFRIEYGIVLFLVAGRLFGRFSGMCANSRRFSIRFSWGQKRADSHDSILAIRFVPIPSTQGQGSKTNTFCFLNFLIQPLDHGELFFAPRTHRHMNGRTTHFKGRILA